MKLYVPLMLPTQEWRGDVADLAGMIKEMADVRIYIEHLATHLGIDLDTACWEKLRKVEKRLEESGPQPSTT